MEFRQLEFLIAAVECKSLNKASEKLYTSQSNISKTIKKLEERLNIKIFERTSKGVYLTTAGEQIYEQAKLIMNTIDHMEEIAENSTHKSLRVSCFPSQRISRKLADFYKNNINQNIHIEFQKGTNFKIVNDLSRFVTDVGIIYYSNYQEQAFKKLLMQNNLEFYQLRECSICVFMGKQHPLSNSKELSHEELKTLKFLQEDKDYFSILDQLSFFTKGKVKTSDLKHVVHTNVSHTINILLKETELCNIGLDVNDGRPSEDFTKKIPIADCNGQMNLGYIVRKDYILSKHEHEFIKYIKILFG